MEHVLPATEETVQVGVISRQNPPVLTVAPGDEVVLETWTHWGGAVGPGTTLADVLRLRERYRGRGPHSLTGPIAVRGAAPGQALQVDIGPLRPVAHGYNIRLPGHLGRGLLPEAFPEGEIRHFRLDLARERVEVVPGTAVPLRPFLGIMAVAPAAAEGAPSSWPGAYGGNIDLTALTEGSTLYLPVQVDGGLFVAGDAHACQGDGEVNLMAIETALSSARLRLDLVEQPDDLRNPWAETPERWITTGFGEGLDAAAREALREMIALLVATRGLSRGEAYLLCSAAADLGVTQAVNPLRGVHVSLAKGLFRKEG